MSSRCSSAPRMQKVYTPRVKDGRRSNENQQVIHYNRSAQKLSYANPQHHNKYFTSNQVPNTVQPLKNTT